MLLSAAVGGGRVPGAAFDRPVQAEFSEGFLEGVEGIEGQGAEWGDPEHSQRSRATGAAVAFGLGQRLSDGAQPCGQRFSGARGGMNQAAVSIQPGLPCLFLKGKDAPFTTGEPCGNHGQRAAECGGGRIFF